MSTIQDLVTRAAGRNAELLSTLAETDHAPAGLSEQKILITDLERQIVRHDARLNQLTHKHRLELADHEKYRDSKARRFLYRATGQGEKFAAKAAKEEREYYDVLQEQHETTVLNDGLKNQLEAAKGVQSDLEAAVGRHNDAQRELDSLYNSIFGGETPRFPEEDQLERISNEALQRYHDARMRFEEETRIVGLIKEAHSKSQMALRHMGDARSASQMDVIGFDFGGLADLEERSALSKAELAYREARSLAERANFENLPRVNLNHGHVMRDMVFDNIFSDLAFHDEIKRGQSEVQRFAKALEERVKQSKERMGSMENELKAAEGRLEESRLRLQEKRAELFQQMAEGRIDASHTSNQPPPVYTA